MEFIYNLPYYISGSLQPTAAISSPRSFDFGSAGEESQGAEFTFADPGDIRVSEEGFDFGDEAELYPGVEFSRLGSRSGSSIGSRIGSGIGSGSGSRRVRFVEDEDAAFFEDEDVEDSDMDDLEFDLDDDGGYDSDQEVELLFEGEEEL